MAINQNIRYALPNLDNLNNPESLFNYVLPSRILTGTVDPTSTDGQLLSYWINTTSGDFFMKSADGIWEVIYNFTTEPGTGITDIINDGTGAQIFKSVIGTDAHIRTLLSADNKCVLLQEANDIAFSVQNLTPADVQLVKSNFNATTDPNNTNDITQGYSIGSYWWNSLSAHLWFCRSNTTLNAVWITFSTGGLNSLANVGLGGVGIFRDITGTTANLKSLTSTDASIIISNNANTVNLQALPPNGIFKDIGSFGFNVISTNIPTPNVEVPLNQPWTYNASFSRGSWSLTGVYPQLNIQRNSTTVGSAPYSYNVQLDLQYVTDQTLVGQSAITFTMHTVTGNISFPPNTGDRTIGWVGPAAARSLSISLNTIMQISDNNPASFYIGVFADTAQTLTNIKTLLTIVQI